MQSATSAVDRFREPLTESDIRDQLQRVVSSRLFINSRRLSRFLRHIVDHALASPDSGERPGLKEYSLGIEVFDRHSDFDPRIDPIVRVEARRLRGKLRQYYQTEGRHDAVLISFCKGSYAPVFRRRTTGSARKVPSLPVMRVRLGNWQRDLTGAIREACTTHQPVELADSVSPESGPPQFSLRLEPVDDGVDLVFERMAGSTMVSFEEIKRCAQELRTAAEAMVLARSGRAPSDPAQAADEAGAARVRHLEAELASSYAKYEKLHEDSARVQTELRHARHLAGLLEGALRATGVGVAVVDRGLRVVLWNHKAESLWDLDDGNAVGRFLFELPGFDYARLGPGIRACLAGRVEGRTAILEDPAGQPILCEIRSAVRSSAMGEVPQGVVLIMKPQPAGEAVPAVLEASRGAGAPKSGSRAKTNGRPGGGSNGQSGELIV